MADQLLAFIAAYLGKGGTGDTPGNKGQCVGLIEVWLNQHKLPHIWGNAKDLLDQADPKIYRVVRNGPDNFPPPGAVVCWDGSWGAGAGHTAVVVAATPMYLAVFEQNDPDGSPPVLGTHGYSGILGWIELPGNPA